MKIEVDVDEMLQARFEEVIEDGSVEAEFIDKIEEVEELQVADCVEIEGELKIEDDVDGVVEYEEVEVLEEVDEEESRNQYEMEATKKASKRSQRQTGKLKAIMTPEEEAKYVEDDRQINAFFDFTCRICNNSIRVDTYEELKQHQKVEHGAKRYEVYCCKKKLISRTALLDHMNFHLNPDQLKCPKCGKLLRDSYQLKNHLERHEDPNQGRKYPCHLCHKSFYHQSLLNTHLMTHLTPEERERLKTYSCPECGKSFESKGYMAHHVRLMHKKTYACVCHICARNFKTKREFKVHFTHLHMEQPDKSFLCVTCNAKFSFEQALKNHIRRMHKSSGIFCCEYCDKVFPKRPSLMAHVLFVHKTVGKYECEVCGKLFKRKLYLMEHMSLHTGVSLYKCPYCEKSFNSNANMYTHRKRMHMEDFKVEQLKKDLNV